MVIIVTIVVVVVAAAFIGRELLIDGKELPWFYHYSALFLGNRLPAQKKKKLLHSNYIVKRHVRCDISFSRNCAITILTYVMQQG